MASLSGTIYIGVSSNLIKRVYQHRNDLVAGFTKKYKCHKLVYFEKYGDINTAIKREKQLKKWSRKKKESLINNFNPIWKDLYDDLLE